MAAEDWIDDSYDPEDWYEFGSSGRYSRGPHTGYEVKCRSCGQMAYYDTITKVLYVRAPGASRTPPRHSCAKYLANLQEKAEKALQKAQEVASTEVPQALARRMRAQLLRMMKVRTDTEQYTGFFGPDTVCTWCGCSLDREERHVSDCFAVEVLGRPSRGR